MRYTRAFKQFTRLSILLLPALAITFTRLVADGERTLPWHTFHEVAIAAAVLTAGFLGHVAYKNHQKDGSEFLAYLALAYLGFAIIYAPHGLLTRASDHHLILFLSFGPVSRLVMAAYLLLSLVSLGRRTQRKLDLRPHLLFFIALAVLLAVIATAGLGIGRTHLRWVEAGSGILSAIAVIRIMTVKVRTSLLTAHLTAQVFFAQCSAAFLLSTPWTGIWWLAHGILAAGFIVLGYALVLTYDRTQAYDHLYDETVLYGLLDRITGTSHVGFLMTDGAFQPVRTNRAIRRMLDAEGRRIDGEQFLALLGLSRAALQTYPSCLTELAASFQYDVRGETRFYEARISPVEPARLDEGFLCVVIDTTEAYRAKEELRHMALHDALTGLPNRTLLYDRLDMALALAARHDRTAAVLMLDLDGFKAVNDRFGHDAGDEVLRAVSARLRDAVRESDTVARLAGDEFVIILSEIEHEADAGAVAANLLQLIAEPILFQRRQFHVTASIGISLYSRNGFSKHQLLKLADTAMYRAKEQGRNAYVIYNETEAMG